MACMWSFARSSLRCGREGIAGLGDLGPRDAGDSVGFVIGCRGHRVSWMLLACEALTGA